MARPQRKQDLTDRCGWAREAAGRPRLTPYGSVFLQGPHHPGLGQGSGQVLPPPPQLFSEELASLVLPNRCCHPSLWSGPESGHHATPVPGGGLAFSGRIPAGVPLPHRKLEAGLSPLARVQALTPRPGPWLASPGEDAGTIVLPAKRFCPYPGLFPPSCSWSPGPRRG